MRKEKPTNPDGTLKPFIYECPQDKCTGVLMAINDQPKMAAAFGVEHVKCDKCGARFARRLS